MNTQDILDDYYQVVMHRADKMNPIELIKLVQHYDLLLKSDDEVVNKSILPTRK
jgi:hypothetical protein